MRKKNLLCFPVFFFNFVDSFVTKAKLTLIARLSCLSYRLCLFCSFLLLIYHRSYSFSFFPTVYRLSFSNLMEKMRRWKKQQTIWLKCIWTHTVRQVHDAHHRAIISPVRILRGINCVVIFLIQHKLLDRRVKNQVLVCEGKYLLWLRNYVSGANKSSSSFFFLSRW